MTDTIARASVTLTHDEANALCGILTDYARQRWADARRTKSASVREYCEQTATNARDLEASIVRRMFQPISDPLE